MVLHAMQHHNPHSTVNKKRTEAHNPEYAALQEEVKAAVKSGDQDQVKVLETKCREMEIKAHTDRHEAQRQQIINTFRNVYHVGKGLAPLIKNPLLSIMLNEQQIANAFCDVSYFGRGAGNALGNNFTLGAIPRDHWSHPAFVRGQRFGDGLSIGLGAAESWLGRGMMGGGSAVMIASGGVLVPIAVPVASGGVAFTTHGSLVMSKAVLEFSKTKHANKHEGRKHNGPSEKHTNLKAKSTAQRDYDKMKADLASYKAEHGNKCDKQKLEWFKKQIKHLKRQADKTGETHGRKGKGQR